MKSHAALWPLLMVWLSTEPVYTARLAKPGSTHPSFPMDAFAKPTFQLIFEDSNPISNRTALDMLRHHSQGEVSSEMGMSTYNGESSDGNIETSDNPLQVYLHRSSPSTLHLCSIPRPKGKPPTTLDLDESRLKDHRSRIVSNALKLLSPLKDTCLFYTMDWFTYSLCYGDAIKQFRALPHTVGGPTAPAMDPLQDSYVLGRWNDQIEDLKESDAMTDLQTNQASVSPRGTELMELVHFSSLDDSNSDQNGQGDGDKIRLEADGEGKGRYISQMWTDGTRCIINNELRTTEVQFHCSKTPARDRISVIKEVTTCSYIVVVDTPRLCSEPALAQVEDEVRQVRCQPIVSDEELAQRKKSAASIDGKSTPTTSASDEKVTSDILEAAKKNREEVKSTIESIVSQINNAVGGPAATELGVIVGWDEDGKFMISPKEQEDEKVAVEGINQVEEADSEDIATTSKAKDKWDVLLEKLLQIETEITDATDGDVIVATIQDTGEVVLETSKEQKREEAKQKVQEQVESATETKAESAPLRTVQLVREKESLGQRAERFYKEQDAQKQREREEETLNGRDRNRDEL